MSVEPYALAEIKDLLGPQGCITDPACIAPYLVSWRNGWQGQSPLIALPDSADQVAETVRVCARHRIGIVPQGGNTGLVGGSIPSPAGDQIVINLSRMNKIRAIDKTGLAVTVEAGVILDPLHDAVAAVDCLFPLSMASQGSAQIGGVISTNAGGTAVLRYGNMRDLVLGIEAVLPNGEIFSGLKSLRKDNMGYNLAQHFIGAEGTLGIVTAATLKLFPKPRQTLTALAAIPTAEAALELLENFRRECGEYLSAFEIMSDTALSLVLKHIPGARLPGGETPWHLLIELNSASLTAPLREMLECVAGEGLEAGCISDIFMATSLVQAKQFWHLREHISEAIRKEGHGIYFDISLPVAALADFIKQTGRRIRAASSHVILAPFGHIGDGNLHYNMCFTYPPDDFAGVKKRIQAIVYEEVIERHGSLSAEHGIGIERKAELSHYRSPTELALMKKIKNAIDPDGLMNPGKIFE